MQGRIGCTRCSGTGWVTAGFLWRLWADTIKESEGVKISEKEICPDCHGSGQVVCPRCQGTTMEPQLFTTNLWREHERKLRQNTCKKCCR